MSEFYDGVRALRDTNREFRDLRTQQYRKAASFMHNNDSNALMNMMIEIGPDYDIETLLNHYLEQE